MPFEQKLEWAKARIKEFFEFLDKYYDELNIEPHKREVILSFSGGKDSTVLFHLVNLIHNQINSKIYIVPAYAYEITFPETISFIKKCVNNYKQINPYVKELLFKKPKFPWNDILINHGYPIFSKQLSVLINRIKKNKSKNGLTKWIFGIDTARFKLTKARLFLLDSNLYDWNKIIPESKYNEYLEYFGPTLVNKTMIYSEKCCDYIKGGLKHINIPSFIGTMASESFLRKKSWINNGCNIINSRHIISRPLSLFSSTDIWKYIYKNNIEINSMYGFKKHDDINECIKNLKYDRLGCVSCPYGSHLEKDNNRFEILYKENKNLYIAQVIKNGMYKVLIDMNIKINDDKKYMELYYLRKKQINEWYGNFKSNLINVILQIENYKNYKKIDLNHKKYKKSDWYYTNDDIRKIFNNYNLDLEQDDINELWNKRNKLKYGK